MYRITRLGEDDFEEEKFSIFKFVPLIGRQGWNK
jgi:protein-L-isoaspartate(D-aspartate) O-methyltransferase